MRKCKVVSFVVVALLLSSTVVVYGQSAGASWGVGAFLDYNRSLFKMKDWFADGQGKVGVVFTYVVGPKVSVEVEYSRSRFTNGSLQERTFTWGVDGKDYLSPGAVSQMTMNNFLVNGIIRRTGAEVLRQGSYAPYLTVGAGFYDYSTDVRNLIYPGQKTAPLDQALKLDAFSDTRTALGVNAGLGVEGFVFDNMAVDLRLRYNVLLGELRPMEAWGIEGQTFPMQFWNVRGGLRFYFAR